MSINNVKRIRQDGDVDYVKAGPNARQPACSCIGKHYPGGAKNWRRTEPIPAPAASSVFVQWENLDKNKVNFVAMLCPEHSRPVKSSITRGAWTSRDVTWEQHVSPTDVAEMGVETFAKMVELDKQRLREHVAQQHEADRLARVRENWTQKRADYNASRGTAPFKAYAAELDDTDEYGRVMVLTSRASMTPNEARDYASRLLELADAAADKTALAKRP